MARPADIQTLDTTVEVGTATGSQIQTHLEFLGRVVEHIDDYNAYQESIGVTDGIPLTPGFLRVGDDGLTATVTSDTPRSYNGSTPQFHIKDSSNV